jgi:hypothetical protein
MKARKSVMEKYHKLKQHDLVDDLMAYESGEMSEQNVKKLFNKLRKSGVGRHLQGHYSSKM